MDFTPAADGPVPSLSDAKHYIHSLDFSNVIDKMVKHQGWNRHHAEKLSDMYRNYLWLCRKYSDLKLPPSDEIDEFWHNHILDTKRYRQDCRYIFGKYFDHYPYFGIDKNSTVSDLNTAFEQMQKLYRQEFGECIENVRPNALGRLIMHFFRVFKNFWGSGRRDQTT